METEVVSTKGRLGVTGETLVQKSADELALEDYKLYLSEMRGGFWKTLFLFALGAVVGMSYYKQILSSLMSLFNLDSVNLVLTSPYQFVNLAINAGFFMGIIFSAPVFLYYLLKFTKPALSQKEFKLVVNLLPISVVLFIVGFAFGVWVLQYVVDLFAQTSSSLSIGNMWDLSGFISQVVIMGLSLALVFQMPIVITTLLKLKFVSHAAIQKQRRSAYAAIIVFAALMPPSDLISLLILTAAPLLLFEVTLFLNRDGSIL